MEVRKLLSSSRHAIRGEADTYKIPSVQSYHAHKNLECSTYHSIPRQVTYLSRFCIAGMHHRRVPSRLQILELV